MKVYVLGDSISIHYGLYLENFSQGKFEYSRKEGEEEALLDIDNPQGANGGDSSMVLSFLKSKLESGDLDADYILINCGLHDLRKNKITGSFQVPIEKYKKNICEIVEIVKQIKPEMIWIRTSPCDENVHNNKGKDFQRFAGDCIEYNLAADKVMKQTGTAVIDLYTFTNNLGNDIYCDHIHFYEHIREKQAAFIAGWMNAVIDKIN